MSCGDPVTPEWLIGMSAGAVCRVLDDPSGSAIEAIVGAAYGIAYDQDRFMSNWVLAGYSGEGGSTWVSPDGTGVARVDGAGSIRVGPA
ncbi:MAG: hypothetical protein KJ956_06340 [Actinobacteria bacterium]|nr:hypothetical protein [Actinomycetota bacterium]